MRETDSADQIPLSLPEETEVAETKETPRRGDIEVVNGMTKLEWVRAHGMEGSIAEVSQAGFEFGFQKFSPALVTWYRRQVRGGKPAGRKKYKERAVGTVTAFVRTFPYTFDRKEVSRLGKAQGLDLEPDKVSKIRAQDKANNHLRRYPKDPAQLTVAKPKGATAVPVSRRRAEPPPVDGPRNETERDFARRVADLGIPRALEICEGMHNAWVQVVNQYTKG